MAPACGRHPAHDGVGICAWCLRERLMELRMEELYNSPVEFISEPTLDEQDLVKISTLIGSDREEQEHTSTFASVLQRTHSWSSSRQGFLHDSKSRNIMTGKDLCENLAEKLESSPSTKRHYKASSWPEIESSQKQNDPVRVGTWIASLFGIKSSNRQGKDHHKWRLFGLGRKKKCAKSTATEEASSEFYEHPKDFPEEFQSPNRFVSSRVSDYNLAKLNRVRSVNSRQKQNLWSSTPLRKFISRKRTEDSTFQEEEKNNYWGISSPKRFHPSPAFPVTHSHTHTNSTYTAFYRDYGSSWSLHSSPMPGTSSNLNKSRYHHHHQQSQRFPSPFHSTGGNTWNFYLTPLRPSRTRHRT